MLHLLVEFDADGRLTRSKRLFAAFEPSHIAFFDYGSGRKPSSIRHFHGHRNSTRPCLTPLNCRMVRHVDGIRHSRRTCLPAHGEVTSRENIFPCLAGDGTSSLEIHIQKLDESRPVASHPDSSQFRDGKGIVPFLVPTKAAHSCHNLLSPISIRRQCC